jgi:hypothetical protein
VSAYRRLSSLLLVTLLVGILAACSGPERASEPTATAFAPSSTATVAPPAPPPPTATLIAPSPTPTHTATASATITPTTTPNPPTPTPSPLPTETPAPPPTPAPTPLPVPASQAIDLPDVDAHYRIEVHEVRVEDGYVRASETITLRAFHGPVPETLYLQIVPAVYGFLTLDSLVLNGVQIEPERTNDGMTLVLDLPPDVAAPVTIDLDFRLSVGREQTGWAGTTLDSGILRLGYWFPVISNDHGYSQTFDPSYTRTAEFDVSVAVDPGVVIAYTGEVVGQETLPDGRTRYQIHAPDVRDVALVLSSRFVVDERTTGRGVRIQVYGADMSSAARQQVLAWAEDALEQLTALVGPYPYPTYRIVDVGPAMPGGVEFPGLIYINPAYYQLDRLIYHETAHQWFYGIIGTRALDDGWIDEGGAEFFERGLPTGFTEVPDVPAGGYRYWLDSTYLELPATPRADWYYSIYEQGARFYYDVMWQMGADAFWAALQALYAEHRFGIVTAWDMLLNWQAHSLTDLRPLYHEYFRYEWIDTLPEPGNRF